MVNPCYMLIPHILMATPTNSTIGFLKLSIKHARLYQPNLDCFLSLITFFLGFRTHNIISVSCHNFLLFQSPFFLRNWRNSPCFPCLSHTFPTVMALLPVISGYFYGIIHSINGVFLVLIIDKYGHNCRFNHHFCALNHHKITIKSQVNHH